MRRIISSTFVSLDGVMQAPGGPAEEPTGGFAFGGWKSLRTCARNTASRPLATPTA